MKSRGLYVTDTTATATDVSRRDRAVQRVRSSGITRVTLYGLEQLLQSKDRAAPLVDLVARLRGAGVREVVVPVAGQRRVELLRTFRASVRERVFDAFVTELETWHACDRAAAGIRSCFDPLSSLVVSMRALANGWGGEPPRVGVYLGTATTDEVRWLAANVDFATLDFPGSTPELAAGGEAARAEARRARVLPFVAAGVETWAILYARGEVPLRATLFVDGIASLEGRFLRTLEARLGPGAARLQGVTWFADDALPMPSETP